jgi:mRNA interferase MazF
MNGGLTRGLVVTVSLDPVKGHEQAGYRPAIIISSMDKISNMRFPVVAVIPVTRTQVQSPFTVPMKAGSGGLLADSFALVDQIRAIDPRRITRTFSSIPKKELNLIEEALRKFLVL